MAASSIEAEAQVDAFLAEQERKSLLRFITCGSVDDGKSTLIGRLLYDSQMIFDDQIDTLSRDSAKMGTQNGEIDFALLVDGLASEREQGITIDVAYRFFSTPNRKYIVADTPGHEQYTRNMATGASTAQLAVILIDARKGVLTQTRRHSYIAATLGIEEIIVAVNKMDLVDHSEERFRDIEANYMQFAESLHGFRNIRVIPVSALAGDNITSRSSQFDWFDGPTLIQALDATDTIDANNQANGFRLPVQWVNRPNSEFRGYSGQITSGELAAGDEIIAVPSMKRSAIERIVTFDGDLEKASAGESVSLTLKHEIDISRGDVICAEDAPCEVGSQFEVQILWMDVGPLHPGRPYLFKIGANVVRGSITTIKYRVDVNTLTQNAAKHLDLNELAVCTIALDRDVAFEPYAESRDLGGLIIIDRMSNATVGLGTINFALHRSSTVQWQEFEVTPETRSKMFGHQGCVVWMTGLSGSGKSTIANIVEKKLVALGIHTTLLDGDNVRHGLNRDLGFSETDRIENNRRVAEVSKLMVDAGLVTLVSFISPFERERQLARDLHDATRFFLVHIDTPLEVAEQRDVKGLYARARAGEIRNFTGIDSPYEAPTGADIEIDTRAKTPNEAADTIIDQLRSAGIFSA